MGEMRTGGFAMIDWDGFEMERRADYVRFSSCYGDLAMNLLTFYKVTRSSWCLDSLYLKHINIFIRFIHNLICIVRENNMDVNWWKGKEQMR